MKQIIRKPNRLRDYDYSANGAYFVTVCTQNKVHCLSRIQQTEQDVLIKLTWQGEIVACLIHRIPEKYPDVHVEHYVIMPNHVHMLLRIDRGIGTGGPSATNEIRTGNPSATNEIGTGDTSATQGKAPALGTILGWWKYQTTKEINSVQGARAQVWQRSYYDHIIRDASDFEIRWKYIEGNPYRWADDEYFTEEVD